jgi:hypothetical protein
MVNIADTPYLFCTSGENTTMGKIVNILDWKVSLKSSFKAIFHCNGPLPIAQETTHTISLHRSQWNGSFAPGKQNALAEALARTIVFLFIVSYGVYRNNWIFRKQYFLENVEISIVRITKCHARNRS